MGEIKYYKADGVEKREEGNGLELPDYSKFRSSFKGLFDFKLWSLTRVNLRISLLWSKPHVSY